MLIEVFGRFGIGWGIDVTKRSRIKVDDRN